MEEFDSLLAVFQVFFMCFSEVRVELRLGFRCVSRFGSQFGAILKNVGFVCGFVSGSQSAHSPSWTELRNFVGTCTGTILEKFSRQKTWNSKFRIRVGIAPPPWKYNLFPHNKKQNIYYRKVIMNNQF